MAAVPLLKLSQKVVPANAVGATVPSTYLKPWRAEIEALSTPVNWYVNAALTEAVTLSPAARVWNIEASSPLFL